VADVFHPSGRYKFALLVAAAAIAVDAKVVFEDIAKTSGLTVPNTSGGKTRKEYILETTGNGVAIFDYDDDGAEDIYIANGSTLDAPKGARSLPQLYHNHGRGNFTEVGDEGSVHKVRACFLQAQRGRQA
jgi:hypothetical protein